MIFDCTCEICSKPFKAGSSNALYCPNCKLKQDTIIEKKAAGTT